MTPGTKLGIWGSLSIRLLWSQVTHSTVFWMKVV
jgi:hypothetical protein